MNDNKRILMAIESSCDDTGVCILTENRQILSNILSSQIDIHNKFGGVVPEIASRQHLEHINPLIDEAMKEADIQFSDLDAVAATRGPGLIGALLIGVAAAKAIAFTNGIPFIGVNHLRGHIYANYLAFPDLKPPFTVLLCSGGHTQLINVSEKNDFTLLGNTLDDAAGEAFDKGARILNLGYPGGPLIQKAAEGGNAEAVQFPRALREKNNYNFSFSGLKTSLLYYIKKNENYDLKDVAASYQEAIIEVLVDKSFKAARKTGTRKVIIAGGVAANQRLREKAIEKAKKWRYEVFFPPIQFCTDNAAMIASAAWQRFINDDFDSLDTPAKPSLTVSSE
ncbi:MAG TPA: tRNA (adenosine(37)-N6)-threonylcarbamoyltransferase complex transferase subunit TsaD [Thermotogota bacterium]|nr:tRNA (adenosine(37)-N6)-threonylcarbamoyltransferase complex transferase subunit TsaD [Thermotogota bacterium]HPJ88448.1 tRNA (adenosine(37)-N6)-threonylcarbamoyltransferase complex transferase subunit TsaD [Thermotogota bacterium]HPR95385.1 tRNA (adenosine(37)-N6)-threonylcarbamoyltransferase complex transferase subunit TsaD [Thermotogota bacterium]